MSRDEMLDVVDENDIVLGQKTKQEIYDQGLYKRLVNIVVIDPETKKIAIQTRGKDVFWQPLHYCVSACGHVGVGEDWIAAAQRELKEEIGIDTPVDFIDKFAFTCEFGKPFMMGVFITEYPHAELKADKGEVDEIFSMDKQEIRELIAKGERLHNVFLPVISAVLDRN